MLSGIGESLRYVQVHNAYCGKNYTRIHDPLDFTLRLHSTN